MMMRRERRNLNGKGVQPHKSGGFCAVIAVGRGKKRHLGTFRTAREAAAVYAEAAAEMDRRAEAAQGVTA